LEPQLARMTVTLSPGASDAQVVRDGVALGRGSLGAPLPVDPGHHVLVATAPGREPRRYEVTVAARQHVTVAVEPGAIVTARERSDVLEPAASRSADSVTDVRAAGDATKASAGRPTLGYVLVGVGAAALATGAYFGVSALGARDDAKQSCADAPAGLTCWGTAEQPIARDRRDSLIADVSFAVAAVAVASGAYLLLRPAAAQGEQSAVNLRLAPRKDGAEVQLAARF
jgi:hypothetical protein